jgi:tRNA-intron lyase
MEKSAAAPTATGKAPLGKKAKKREAKKEAKLAERRQQEKAKRQQKQKKAIQKGGQKTCNGDEAGPADLIEVGVGVLGNGEQDAPTSTEAGPATLARASTASSEARAAWDKRHPRGPKNDGRVLNPGGCGGVELLSPPKRKGGGKAPLTSPLPVRVKIGGVTQPTHKCRSTFMGYCVWVVDDGHMQSLYSQGFFGKGFLSKSIPEKLVKGRDKRKQLKKGKRDGKANEDRKRKRDVDTGGSPVERSKSLRVGDDSDVVTVPVGTATARTPTVGPATGAVPEYLQLSLVEAFFLTYALDALAVHDDRGAEMSRLQCWTAFRNIDSAFAENYAVYHYLRGIGWVPKSGLKFGVEFLAYRKGPQYYHSSYSIMIRAVDAKTLEPVQTGGHNRREMTWATLANLTRLTSQVAKELVLCYVLIPPTMTEEEWESPTCLEGLTVQHTMLRRWIPEKTRYGGATPATAGTD